MPSPAQLPDPADVKRLMTLASSRLDDLITKLRLLAAEYGVHGRVFTHGQYSFQLTRVNERWSIYIVHGTAPARDLQGSKLDEKLLFLEKADEFEAEYGQRIRDLYETLQELAEDRG